jgi:hypothetical protein
VAVLATIVGALGTRLRRSRPIRKRSRPAEKEKPLVTLEEIRRVALSLPRTEEALVRERVKFRVGRIVYVALSRDELSMGCGFPREERAALVAAEPEKFFMPIPSEMRYQWIEARLTAIDAAEMRELVTDAWCMCVPKRLAGEHLGRDRGEVPRLARGEVPRLAVSSPDRIREICPRTSSRPAVPQAPPERTARNATIGTCRHCVPRT